MDDAKRLARNAYMRAWKRANKEKVNKTNQHWKDANRELVRERGRDYAAKARATDPQKGRDSATKWARQNPEKVKQKQAEWLAKHPGYHAEWARKNRVKNPVLYLWRSARSRAKKEGIVFTITKEDLQVPEYCPVLGTKLVVGKGAFTDECASIDRVIPELGYVPGNVRVISMRANVLKRNATPEELMAVALYAKRETDIVCGVP